MAGTYSAKHESLKETKRSILVTVRCRGRRRAGRAPVTVIDRGRQRGCGALAGNAGSGAARQQE
ncbi:hypothetical protein SAM23877_6958 [Streptomyces ambofaciens ATCC 23877]|uniref:Uncharacterized protein n=1 Tax=Streptomyces ambofaciens (strain ATCC 23877 / 3486 / DSM 40053 / JCM 4204 / NBRC 12836 / NRRL B-2516) TaxID=278992 RepID=A0A0K2B442_STRA7|nr:hypothetical protein SAM23877_6958 [Streptomyces ambofaciens ATCC 23877]